jgi:hypothetical protein
MPQSDPAYIVADFESYYDQEYSLRRMTPVEYIMDPRFEITGCAVAEGDDGPAMWLDTEQLPDYFRSKAHLPFVSHNALFDMCIMTWRLGVRPPLMIDTMGMARATVAPFTKGVSLAKVSNFFGFGMKTDTILKVSGMGRDAIRANGLWMAYTTYAINDAHLCREAYKRMRASFPRSELLVMDMVIRMAACPGFVLNRDELAVHAATIAAEKQALLDRVGLSSRDDLMSNEKFASALSALGVVPPMKTSKTTGMAIYAFAKSDAEMTALEEHENPDVQALVAARLGHKSTLEETRTARFQNIANIDWQGAERPLSMPIPLKYSGAHTHRLCLVGETIIVALRDNLVVQVRLDNLLPTDLVWDGDWFVKHGGLAYAGRKHVISHDGITGTPDHRVWTVELGYCALETAKARGFDIVRGEFPDASRIDPSVLRTNPVQDTSEVYLQPVRARSAQHVEGPALPRQGMVQVMRISPAHAGGVTLQGNVGGCSSGEQGGCREATTYAGSDPSPDGGAYPREYAVTDTEVGPEVGPGRLARRYDDVQPSVPEMHEPTNDAVRVLRRQGHHRGVCIDGSNGRLDTDQLGPAPVWHDVGPDGHQRALRTGEPALGDVARADGQPQLVETWDIVDCGPRNRFMANGRIVHNSGDWSLNAQNLGRSSRLRYALEAPQGYKVVAGDASQIEARLNAVVCGQEDLVQSFREGRDVYSEFASEEIYHRPVSKKTDPAGRFVGKTCLAEGTLVVTDRGAVPIEEVTTGHKVWDGEEWVCHQGLANNGFKKTLKLCGVSLTPDHLVLCGTRWLEAQQLARDEEALILALDTASEKSPSPATSGVTAQLWSHSLSNAGAADRSTRSTTGTSRRSKAHGAMSAPKKPRGKSAFGVTQKRYLTMGIGVGCSTGWPQLSTGATTLTTGTTGTTESVVSLSATSGVKTGPRFSVSPRRSTGGTSPATKWTASKTLAGTPRVTSGSCRGASTSRTNGASKTSKTRLRVYDICSAGPRHRFTILTDRGPMIVHNCILSLGYQSGWATFKNMIRVQSRQQLSMEMLLSDPEAQGIVNAYRRRYAEITKAWKTLSNYLPDLAHRDSRMEFGPMRLRHQYIESPGGLHLYYHDLKQEMIDGRTRWRFTHAGIPKDLYGGKMLENMIQHLARLSNMDAASRLRRRWHPDIARFVLQVHDELVYVVRDDAVAAFLPELEAELSVAPWWAPNAPLAAEVKYGQSYGEAK